MRWPLAAAGVAAVVLLGPALGPGLTLAYDLGWSPDPRFTPFVTGSGSVAPRAVPSDAVGVALGRLVGAAPAEKLVLVAILVLAGAGCAALLRHLLPAAGGLALSAAAVAGVWNPFVVERLAIGQWTVLLGYALLPLLLLAALRARARGGVVRVAALTAAAGAGGANTLLMTVPVALVVLLWPRPAPRAAATTAVVALGSAAVWALPALRGGVTGDPAGVSAFAPVADTPLGLLGSVLSGGGMWNAAAHPASRGVGWIALAAATVAVASVVAVAVGRDLRSRGAVVGTGVVALLLVLASGLPTLRGPWSELLALPGGGLLRDSQKLLAPWVVLLAVGTGLLAHRGRARLGEIGPVAATALTLLPVALLPTAAWGIDGRLEAVEVPEGYRAAATELSAADPGLVGVLPWGQYRRYHWNGARVSLGLAPRIVDQRVLQDDGLPLRTGRVAGEDPAARAVTAAIAAGSTPAQALRQQGVRYVMVERGAGGAPTAEPAGTVLADTGDVLVVDLGPAPSTTPPPQPAPVALGWLVTGLTWAATGAALLVVGGRRLVARGVGDRRRPLLPSGS